MPSAVREGIPFVVASAVIAALLGTWRSWAGWAGVIFTGWVAWFFRDPERSCPASPDLLYSPADGLVTAVDEVESDWHVEGRAARVVIFLSPLDVHVNRSPGTGRLVARRREPGRALPAFLVAGAGNNARQLLAFELVRPSAAGDTTIVPVVVVQIVGFLVRRIVLWRWPGEEVVAGDRLGMLRFGSRTDLVIPGGVADILVAKGDRVIGGITPLARWRSDRSDQGDRASTDPSSAWTPAPSEATT